jgi:hypothetical protein
VATLSAHTKRPGDFKKAYLLASRQGVRLDRRDEASRRSRPRHSPHHRPPRAGGGAADHGLAPRTWRTYHQRYQPYYDGISKRATTCSASEGMGFRNTTTTWRWSSSIRIHSVTWVEVDAARRVWSWPTIVWRLEGGAPHRHRRMGWPAELGGWPICRYRMQPVR